MLCTLSTIVSFPNSCERQSIWSLALITFIALNFVFPEYPSQNPLLFRVWFLPIYLLFLVALQFVSHLHIFIFDVPHTEHVLSLPLVFYGWILLDPSVLCEEPLYLLVYLLMKLGFLLLFMLFSLLDVFNPLPKSSTNGFIDLLRVFEHLHLFYFIFHLSSQVLAFSVSMEIHLKICVFDRVYVDVRLSFEHVHAYGPHCFPLPEILNLWIDIV